MTVQEALTYIHSVCWKGSIPGLERTRELLSRMGNPEKRLRFVHIAGTNGKGSTAAMTASILRAAGCRTGLYTSPYILRFHERMQVDGREITDQELSEVTAFVRPHAEAMADHPTEFELVSCIAFEFFARAGCDIVVLEVGMGGELDSTNVIGTPEAAVITNIGLDHTEYLGGTLEEIASAKAGIIKPGGTAVIYREAPSVEAVFEEKCRAVGARLVRADFDSLRPVRRSLEGQVFDAGGRAALELPLLGAHQLKNAAVVLAAVEVLRDKGWRISEQNIREGLASVTWPGRFEVLRKSPLFLVDGGHNPQCVEALVQNIRDYLPDKPLTVLTGVLADKDYHCMYESVAPYARAFVTVTPDSPRALDAQELAAYLRQFGKPVTACGSVEAGVAEAAAQAGPAGVVLAYGSLYMVGAIRQAARA
ncbi:MAG: bifunctional folylpolyglutamate synthase/dihydrofolate synthase [Oscillospiraceae bacterium]|nr:bifunctional folylpolyglutamate synthase/dihydrofolate synthase [Oscillospiraceae bacterium]